MSRRLQRSHFVHKRQYALCHYCIAGGLNHPQHFCSLLLFTRAHKVKHKETQKQHFCLLISPNWQITVTELERKQDKPITGGWAGKPTLESAAEIKKKKKSGFSFLSVITLSVVFIRSQKSRITKLAKWFGWRRLQWRRPDANVLSGYPSNPEAFWVMWALFPLGANQKVYF